jgi:DNA polymerase (family 10)
MKNLEVAEIFRKIADILEIKGENPFRIRAYQKAAQNIEDLTSDLEDLARKDRLTELPGVGEDLALKIKEILKTGTLKQYEKLKKEIPQGLIEMLEIPGLGPKTVKLLFKELKIKNIATLKRMAKKGKLLGLPGIREKTVENILRGIALLEKGAERMPLHIAYSTANEIITGLKGLKEIKKISPAGSLRRMKETVRDIDILVTSTKPQLVMDKFTTLPLVKEIIGKGATKSSILTTTGVQVDVRVVNQKSYGAALLYFTGSKLHNIKLRMMAQKKKWKINEYGLFSTRGGKGNRQIAGASEEEIYGKLKLSFIPAELREDSGEIEAALFGKLPHLIDYNDIKGDLHVHSNWSDGAYTLEQLALAAKKRGYEYIAITDHSQSLKVAGGLSVSDLKKQIKEIHKLNKKFSNPRLRRETSFTLLTGAEVDIKDDGSLDYPDFLLKELDIVICAIHTGFKQSKEKLTRRIIKAMQNKYSTFISHPSGRLMGTREAYELDYDEIFKVACDTNTFLEINAYPLRLDLTDVWARRAKEERVKIVIATDAHTLDQLDYIKYGVATARRGWLEKKDVVNTLPLKKLREKIKR